MENSKHIRCPYIPEKCEYRPCLQTHIFCFGESPSPSYSKKKILFELLRKRLDFIRLSDYNMIWIIVGRSEWDRSGPWNTYQSHRPLNDGVFPPGAYRFYVPKGVSQAPSALEQYGAFQMMSQSPQTQESKAESTLRSPLKIKNEPQTIATLTRNRGRYPVASVAKSLDFTGFFGYL